MRDDFFALCEKLSGASNDFASLCQEYSGKDVQKWYQFMSHFDAIKAKAEACLADDKNMEIGDEVSLPAMSFYDDSDFDMTIPDWIWIRANSDSDAEFSFDSEAEKAWAKILLDTISVMDTVSEIKSGGRTRYLWGKNFPFDSAVKFAYYNDGVHDSYPDFVMKDKNGRIRIFETKSLNQSSTIPVDDKAYKQKIEALIKGYTAASNLLDYVFYIPIQIGSDWRIHRIEHGSLSILQISALAADLIK